MEKQVSSFLLCGACTVYAHEHGGSCTLHTHEELVQNRVGLALNLISFEIWSLTGSETRIFGFADWLLVSKLSELASVHPSGATVTDTCSHIQVFIGSWAFE